MDRLLDYFGNYWYMWLTLSAVILGLSLLIAFFELLKYKRNRFLTPNKIIFVGSFFAAFAYFVPLYYTTLKNGNPAGTFLRTACQSLIHSFKVFAFDGGFVSTIYKYASYPDESIKELFVDYGALLYLLYPLMSVAYVLSFFKNLYAFVRYSLFSLFFWKTTHIFSELNEKTLALASSIRMDNIKKRKWIFSPTDMIVFTDIIDKKDERTLELLEGAKELGAVLFRRDLASVRFRGKVIPRKLKFYLLSDKEEDKIRHTKELIKNYDVDGVELRLFSQTPRSELVAMSMPCKVMDFYRLDDIRAYVYNNLYTNGHYLFKNARTDENGEKVISAVIVGLGRYGREMFKALNWYCKLPGYRFKITAFDSDNNAEQIINALCPELMSDRYNHAVAADDDCYDITIHSGVDISHASFREELKKIDDATYIFVCLGDDDTNLSAAAMIRSVCEGNNYVGDGKKPVIETVVYDSDMYDGIGVTWEQLESGKPAGVHNTKNQDYNIIMSGDLVNMYSVHTLVNSELDEKGRAVNWRYCKQYAIKDFEDKLKKGEVKEEQREELLAKAKIDADQSFCLPYNYFSSVSKAIHEDLRVKLGLNIPGVNKAWENRSDEERLAIGKIEHPRWNAYMRSEGYVYSGSLDRSTRNDLGKVHNNLVAVGMLDDDTLRKDA